MPRSTRRRNELIRRDRSRVERRQTNGAALIFPDTQQPRDEKARQHKELGTKKRHSLIRLFTGDAIARGDSAVYASSRGPSSAWSPNPITYAFNWLKNMRGALGMEMVDEVTTSYSVPLPQGTLGQPNGPKSISCVAE
jgi:hypothetical protein